MNSGRCAAREKKLHHARQLAKSLQVATEEIIIHMLNRLYEKTKSKNVCMTGGVAKLSRGEWQNPPQERRLKMSIIPAGAADNGTSFGSDFTSGTKCLANHGHLCRTTLIGFAKAAHRMRISLTRAGLPFDNLPERKLVDRVSDLLIDGKVVGWFQGRMEFGARALGNRSLPRTLAERTCETSST